jgi:hypothetical protein
MLVFLVRGVKIASGGMMYIPFNKNQLRRCLKTFEEILVVLLMI